MRAGHPLCNSCFVRIGGSVAKCPTCRRTIGSIRNRPLEKLRARYHKRTLSNTEHPAAAPTDAGAPEPSVSQSAPPRPKLLRPRHAPRSRGVPGANPNAAAGSTPFAFAIPAAAAAGAAGAPPAASFGFAPETANISVPGGYRFTFDPPVPLPQASAAAAPAFRAATSWPTPSNPGWGHSGGQSTAASGEWGGAGVSRGDVPPAGAAGCTSSKNKSLTRNPEARKPVCVFASILP